MRLSAFLLFLSLSTLGFTQSFYDEGTIQTIEITFSQANWDALLDAEMSGSEGYTMAQTVSINGTVFDSVGVKYKGNSSYNASQIKNPFHIELDTYKSQDYQGYKDIKLSNVANDPSFVREVLSYKILRQYMDAPQSNYANLYVNGTLIGLYVSSEAINKTFLNDRFMDKNNSFFKCNPPAGAGPGATDLPSLEYLGTDTLLYLDSYEMKSDSGWLDLVDFCDTLSNYSSAIEDILDVDRALYMMAFDNILVNLDSYIGGFKQNYYLYRDDYGKFLPIVWDLNESFGRFSMTGTSNLTSTTQKQQLTHLLHMNDAGYPLVQQLLANPLYKRMYLAHCKTILLENFDNNSYYTDGQGMQMLIDASVQADVNKFFTYANFVSNLTTDVSGGGGPGPGGSSTPGITNLMDGRSTYLLSQTDFTNTQPTISSITESNSSPLINDVVTITAAITDETDVYLGYRNAAPEHFTRVLMYDDGAHNDGAAGDGVYGVDVTIQDLTLEYYIYADNNQIGRFSPARAEHEYYVINAVPPAVGDLVINELQADNANTILDPTLQYDDWIELYNNSSNTILLDTLFLSDDAGNLMAWQFPTGETIAAGAYYIVWADKDTLDPGIHTNFKLSSNGETIYLSSISGNIIDQVTFEQQTTDLTYGRYPNGTGAFQVMTPTYAAQNSNELGIEVIQEDEMSIRVYPNPAEDFFIVEIMNQSEELNVDVYDILGKSMISSKMNNSFSVSTADWPSGLYMVRVGNTVQKVMVR